MQPHLCFAFVLYMLAVAAGMVLLTEGWDTYTPVATCIAIGISHNKIPSASQ
jgi:hypothetical protein